ncbi:MAG: WYL domain-containing protein [Actinobacteria bacterium]|nr:WYL domain-containing protein [Actinomycetota bacterium]
MSHDSDKLIRQLSLVAFLMAERRPLTARDVKGNVEGYSEMSDEAFARRFYSDRAELTALGVPLTSQRDEFTGEELYTLRSEHYFLDQLELDEDELAALQTALYTLEGKFAYAEPLRLALQNLALGRPGFRHAPTATAERVRVTAPDYSPELGARLSKLESAISKQRTIQFRYWTPARDRETERRLNPYALRLDEGVWYVIGHDLDRDAIRTFRVARVRSDIRFATRRERDFRQPVDFDVEAHRVVRPWQIGSQVGTARIEVQGDTAWWVHRTLADAGTVENGVFETSYSTLGPLVSWILRQNGRAIPLEPAELRHETRDALVLLRERHTGAAPATARERRIEARPPVERQPAGPVAPERFGVLQALLAHLLAACGDERTADLGADELAGRFSLPREELQPTLSLLNLVNFGGGCYTVYAEVDDDTNRVHVDKELYGDVFRKAPKLTPLEARAIRLAIEYVGPTIAADAHTPLDRVRLKLEETFGQFNLAPAKASQAGDDEEALVRTLSNGADERRLVELEYLKEGDEEPSTRLVEPYTIERELPYWRVHTWDRTVDGPRTYRLDRMRSARLTKERFEPRIGFDPNYLSEPAVAQLWHAPPIARWKLERGARALTDRSARSEVTFKTEEWLLSEVLADRGETVVFEPESMRRAVAARARALQAELGLSPRRKRTVEPA